MRIAEPPPDTSSLAGLLTLKRALEQQAHEARDQQRLPQALAIMRQAAGVAETLSSARFDRADTRYELARTLQDLALMEHDAGNLANAIARLERSIRLLEPLAVERSSFHVSNDARRDLAQFTARLGQYVAERADTERARELLQSSLAMFECMCERADSPAVDVLIGFSEALCCLGGLEVGAGDTGAGLQYLERALQMARTGAMKQSGPRHWHQVYDVLRIYLHFMNPAEDVQAWRELALHYRNEAQRLNEQFRTDEFTLYAEGLEHALAELEAERMSSGGR